MQRRATRIAGACALAVAVFFAGAAPASAVSYSGSVNCTGVSYVSLTIDAKGAGNGSWQNRSTGAVSTFTFPGGNSKKTTSWLNVNWVTAADAGFYRTPYTRCGA